MSEYDPWIEHPCGCEVFLDRVNLCPGCESTLKGEVARLTRNAKRRKDRTQAALPDK